MKYYHTKINNKKGIVLTGVAFLIIIFYMFVNATPYHRHRTTARLKACFSNQRVILGAVEMYNLDNKIPIETALPGYDFEKCEELLMKDNYLKNNIDLPESDCSYGFFDIIGSGTVFCKRHGSIFLYSDKGDITLPSYNATLEKPFSKPYLEQRNKRIREKEFRDTMNKISSPIFNILFSPVTGLLLAVTLIAIDIIKSTKKDDDIVYDSE